MAGNPEVLQILRDIATGKYDDNLEAIREVVSARGKDLRRVDATVKLATFKPGDRLTVGRNVTPKYLAGVEVEVLEVGRARVSVKIIGGVPWNSRFKVGQTVRATPGILQQS